MKMRFLLALLLLAACQKEPKKADHSPGNSDSLWNGKGFAGRCEESRSKEIDKTTFFSVSGNMAEPFHSVAVLTMTDGTMCSAVLIAPDKMVTAAHCFDGKTSIASARFKDSSTEISSSLPVKRVVLHPEYRQALNKGAKLAQNPELASFDIAMVELAEAVTDRSPTELTASANLYRGQLVSLVGFGDIGLGAGTKRFAQSHVGQVVTNYHIGDVKFTNLMLLDSSLASGACPGDSGGGVFVKTGERYYLIGLVQGVNDVLYPGFPVKSCQICPRGIGIVALLDAHREFLGID